MRPRMLLSGSIACLIGLASCSGDPQVGRRETPILIRAGHVFDGVKDLGPVGVLVEGHTIKAVGEFPSVPEGAKEYDFPSGSIVPGFIDSHVHLYVPRGQLLRTGVTTVRDLGQTNVSSDKGELPGELRYLSAGPLLSAPDGAAVSWFPGITQVVRSPRQAERVATQLTRDGADLLKVYLEPGARDEFRLIPLEVLTSIVDTAHANGLTVAAHVSEEQGIVLSIKAGVDEFAHTPCRKVKPDLLRRAISQKMTMVSTLHVRKAFGCPSAITNARTWLSLGGSYVYGSDMGNRGIPDALDVRELELMKRAGLSHTGVLRAATSEAGANLGLAPLGTLTPGAVADLVVVVGNPLEDFDVLRAPALVMSKGRIVRRP